MEKKLLVAGVAASLVVLHGTCQPDHPATPGETGGRFTVAIRAGGCDDVGRRQDPTFSVCLDQGVYDGDECAGYLECGSVEVGTTEPVSAGNE